MENLWVVLSGERVEILEKKTMPAIQARGKKMDLFPLYIQCRSRRDAEDVCRIHEPLAKLHSSCSNVTELARAIYHSVDCSGIMHSVNLWYVLFNGRSFRGIIQVASDFDIQTRDFQFASWRDAESFEDALLIMVLKGDKPLLTEIKASSPSIFSVATNIDHLSLSSSFTSSSDNVRASPSLSACGKMPARLPGGAPGQPGPSQGPRATAERKFTLQRPPALTHYSQWPHSPVHLPAGNRSSVKPIYKYIQNVTGTVGTITDRSGVLSHITDEDFNILGDVRARYLDSHGYGSAELVKIVSAFEGTTSMDEFISCTEGCGMSIVELEWFWSVE